MAPINDLERNQDFRKKPLKRVVPTRPAIKQAALKNESVKKNSERRRPCKKPDLVAGAESLAVRRQQMLRLLAGVTLLRRKPARERLAIVVEDDSGKRFDFTSNHDPMTVALVTIGRVILSIKHGTRRI